MLAWRHAFTFRICNFWFTWRVSDWVRGREGAVNRDTWNFLVILVHPVFFWLKIRVGKKVKIWLEPQARWVRWSQGAPPPAPASPAPPSSTPSTGWALLSAAPEPAWCSCPPSFRKDSWTVVLFGWLSKWFLGSGHFAEILTGSIDEFKIFQKRLGSLCSPHSLWQQQAIHVSALTWYLSQYVFYVFFHILTPKFDNTLDVPTEHNIGSDLDQLFMRFPES